MFIESPWSFNITFSCFFPCVRLRAPVERNVNRFIKDDKGRPHPRGSKHARRWLHPPLYEMPEYLPCSGLIERCLSLQIYTSDGYSFLHDSGNPGRY